LCFFKDFLILKCEIGERAQKNQADINPWVFVGKYGMPSGKINSLGLSMLYTKKPEFLKQRHLLRRTFSTHLIKTGVGIESVSKLPRHPKTETI